MLTYGVSPIEFCLSVIVPIPMNKRANKCDSSNYRAIAISILLGKIYRQYYLRRSVYLFIYGRITIWL